MKEEKKIKLWRTLMDLGRLCGCHQKPERSFFYHNFQFPFCSRCLGIIMGELIIGPIVLLCGVNLRWYNLIFLMPLIIDGSIQYLSHYESTNIRRLITGLMAGAGFTMFIISMIFLSNK